MILGLVVVAIGAATKSKLLIWIGAAITLIGLAQYAATA